MVCGSGAGRLCTVLNDISSRRLMQHRFSMRQSVRSPLTNAMAWPFGTGPCTAVHTR